MINNLNFKKMNLNVIKEKITFKNFFISTKVVFKGCKIPKRKPDFISMSNYGGYESISSMYWYGKDKKGAFVIRVSDHWVMKYSFTQEKEQHLKHIRSCIWNIKTNQESKNKKGYEIKIAGKAYLKDFLKI
mgnify:CR=1 FL=1